MMKYRSAVLIIALIVSLMAQHAVAQTSDTTSQPAKKYKTKGQFMQRAYFGGYLGLQFGTITYIDISPMLTYRVTDQFYTGFGLSYQYIKDKRYTPEYATNGYGAKIFARYHVWKDLFVQAEYDPLYRTYQYDELGNNVGDQSIWVHDILLGAGYRQWLGGRSFLTLAIFYNINETFYSPYRNPIINIGIGFGF